MKRFFFTAIVSVALVGFLSCSGVQLTHSSCVGVHSAQANQKAIPSNFYKAKVQKIHERAVKRQRKTAAKADRAGNGIYRYN